MDTLQQKAKQGIKLMLGRQVLLQVATFGGGVVLARILSPAQFGIYGIATFLVSLLAMIGDFGLAPSFIQRKEELTDLDLRVGFTLQQVLTTVIVSVLLVIAPWLAHFYPQAPPETVWLIRALAFNLYLTSWRSMSALQLERHLRYDRLAMIEVVETVVYQGLAVVLAATGHGIWSFVWAAAARGGVGTILVFRASPWAVRLAYNTGIVLDIFKFGIPFQMQTIFNSSAYWVIPALVGTLIGPQAVGFLTWASANGKKPLMLVDTVMRVSFPHFSRLQENKAEVERLLLRYLIFLLLPAGLWLSVLLVCGPALVHVIYTDKWAAAVPALQLYAVCLQADVISFAVTVALNALGKVGFTARVYAVRAAVSTVLTVPLIYLIGFIAVPLVYGAVIGISNLWLLSGLGWVAARRIMSALLWLLLPASLSILAGESMLYLFSSVRLQAAAGTLIVTIVYAFTMLLAGPEWIKNSVKRWLGRRAIRLARFVQYWGEDVDVTMDQKVQAFRDRGVRIGDNAALWNISIDPIYPELITLGSNVTMTNTTILTHDDSSVLCVNRRRVAPVTIGDHVFVGWSTIILPGVTIGSHCIIGAGSVVTRDIPAYSIAAGVPARVIQSMPEHIEGLNADPALIEFQIHSNRISSDEHDAMKRHVQEKYD